MKTSKGLLIVAVILGLLTVFLLNLYIKTLGDPAVAPVTYSDVVVARTTIPAHTRITLDMLEVASIPSEAVHPAAVRDTSSLLGGISRGEIIRGEQVLTNRVATEDRGATMSYRIPDNMRAISIPVNEITGIAGYVSAGDKVDILVTYSEEGINDGTTTTYTVFQNVLVLATGEFPKARDDEERRVVGTFTLAVTPEQAEVLAYSFLSGSFHLTLRSPADERQVDLDSFSSGNFDDFRGR